MTHNECGCDEHRNPTTHPWSAWLAQPGKDGVHRDIIVAPSRGHHVTESDAQWIRDRLNAPTIHQEHCNCRSFCGDDGDVDGPGTCKGLPRAPEPPLVEIVVVDRDGGAR